jgi:sulfur-oxidizing protein SoxZ
MSTIKLRLKRDGGKLLVRALITHPMDTGRKLDAVSGTVIPAHFIEALSLFHNDRIVADCRLSTAVSKDPYISFRLKDGAPGDRIKLVWKDNLGLTDSAEVVVD